MSKLEVFTPTIDGVRVRWRKKSVEWVEGADRRGPGVHGIVRYRGEYYRIEGAPCGLNCYCDATATKTKRDPGNKEPAFVRLRAVVGRTTYAGGYSFETGRQHRGKVYPCSVVRWKLKSSRSGSVSERFIAGADTWDEAVTLALAKIGGT